MRPGLAHAVVLAAPLLLLGQAVAGEAGLALGTHAPPLNGGAWVTEDGKQPDMKNKVLLVEFWFAG